MEKSQLHVGNLIKDLMYHKNWTLQETRNQIVEIIGPNRPDFINNRFKMTMNGELYIDQDMSTLLGKLFGLPSKHFLRLQNIIDEFVEEIDTLKEEVPDDEPEDDDPEGDEIWEDESKIGAIDLFNYQETKAFELGENHKKLGEMLMDPNTKFSTLIKQTVSMGLQLRVNVTYPGIDDER